MKFNKKYKVSTYRNNIRKLFVAPQKKYNWHENVGLFKKYFNNFRAQKTTITRNQP